VISVLPGVFSPEENPMQQGYVKFGAVYRRFREKQFDKLTPESSWRDTAYGQMCVFVSMAHERAGTNQAYESRHRQAIRAALGHGARDFGTEILSNENFAEDVWSEFHELCSGKSNKPCTFGPMAGSIELLRGSGSPYWTDYFQGLQPHQSWLGLQELKGIGPKLASFIMRDFQMLYGCWDDPPADTWYCFQPLDRWVLRVSRMTWPDLEIHAAAPATQAGYRETAQKICDEFGTLDESMDFNAGAWFVGAHRAELLAFHGCIFMGKWNDEQDMQFHRTVKDFDAARARDSVVMELPDHWPVC
jgi:hypothetical protein